MIGRQERWQEDLFVAGPLRDVVPEDHILRRVDRVLDLSWLRGEVRDTYDTELGRPGIDPEAAVRLMLAGFFQGMVHDRKLMREARVNLAIRWFAGYRLDEALPHHSSLTRIRQRWGTERFKRIFQKTVDSCIKAGLVSGETVHVDATLIRADVSWKSLSTEHAERVLSENNEDAEGDAGDSAGRSDQRSPTHKLKKRSSTDPDATLTTSSRNERMEPSYKQHTAVDDQAGVIVDVHVTTGEHNEGVELLRQINRIEQNTQKSMRTVTGDCAYAHAQNYAALEERNIAAVIPPQPESRRRTSVPLRLFKWDPIRKGVRCPQGRELRASTLTDRGQFYRARKSDCAACPLKESCVPRTASSRSVLIVHGYAALLRARRAYVRWGEAQQSAYRRHRWRVEGVHGESKTQHGLRRAVRRGLSNVAIQAYLTAAVINLKRLASHCCAVFQAIERVSDVMKIIDIQQTLRRLLKNKDPDLSKNRIQAA